MADPDDPAVGGGGVSLTARDLLIALKLSADSSLLHGALLQRIAAARARAEGLAVTDEEIADALAQFFADRDLFEDEDVRAWLAAMRLDEDCVRAHVADSLLAEKLKMRLVPDEAARARYQASPHLYATVQVERLRLESEGAASELAMSVREQELTWADAARRAGGFEAETLRRADAPGEAAALLFSARPGQIVGPVETDEEGYLVYRVRARAQPDLDEELVDAIRNELFEAELSATLAKDPLTFFL